MILRIRARDIWEGDFVMLGDDDYRIHPLWVMVHSANYIGRRLQLSTQVGIVTRKYSESVLVDRLNPFEERMRLLMESAEERRKRSEWYGASVLDRFRKGGEILEDGSIVPLSTPRLGRKRNA